MKYIICFLILIQRVFLVAQNQPPTYEIGGVEVKGANYSDENAIKTISGLKVGESIQIPGPKIPKAVKALLNLKLYSNVAIVQQKTIGEIIFLEIQLTERPRLIGWSYSGVKKSYQEDINKKIEPFMLKGGIVTENNKKNTENAIKNFFIEKGYLDAKASIREVGLDTVTNQVKLVFNCSRGPRIKIQNVVFEGNKSVPSRKLRSKLSETKVKRKLFSSSKFIAKEYKNDKSKLIQYYNKLGFRDAKIVNDSTWRQADGDLMVKINLEEGNKYYYRNISWKGNNIHTVRELQNRLNINKGDSYNQELLENRLKFSLDGTDVSSLYMDDGYLAFNVEPIESSINNDSIDIEMRIFEGPQFNIDKVIIKGNDISNEHVIRRELRTKPGAKFSRADLIRSNREIVNLGYFNPETIGINTPVNQKAGTVDIEYTVEEKPNDQLELSAGYGGNTGLIGTLGVTFNNFSVRNINKPETWHPLPKGDGQRLSLRGQTNGRYFQSYNASFTEPWLGGKKPNSFSIGGFYTRYSTISGSGFFSIISGTAGIGTRLKWPDDNFIINAAVTLMKNRLNNYGGLFDYEGTSVDSGSFHNFNLKLTLARTTIADPIFPRDGSRISLSAQFTPPYSFFGSKDYNDLSIQKRFNFLEYHKWRLDMEYYKTITGKLVMRIAGKFGFLGTYNKKVGLSPFERFEIGGDGLSNSNNNIVGKDILALRGYEVEEVRSGNNISQGGAAVFNKYTVELRYPITLSQSTSIFVLGFLEGGNMWNQVKEYNPFDLKRSAGLGLRVFLPMFGLLGFDYGYGFDKQNLINEGASWNKFGKFSFIIGFEPE